MLDPITRNIYLKYAKVLLILVPLGFLYLASIENTAFQSIIRDASRQKDEKTSENLCKEYQISSEIAGWKERKEIVGMRAPIQSFRTWKNGTLGQCRIPKSMHTVVEYVFGYISNSQVCDLTGEFKMDRSLAACQYQLVVQQPDMFRVKGWTPFAIVRDPVNRFLSGWLDKCIIRLKGDNGANGESRRTLHPLCYDCGRDLECFIKRNYAGLKDQANPVPSERKSAYFGGQDHYFPWNWHCRSFSGIVMQYLKYDRSSNSKFYEEFGGLLRTHDVDEAKIKVILDKIKSTGTIHKTFGSPAWKDALDLLVRRDDLYKMILKTYYYDYMETDLFPMFPTFKCWLENNQELKASNYGVS